MSPKSLVWDSREVAVRGSVDPGARRAPGRGTVLVVDDDADVRSALTLLLSRDHDVVGLAHGVDFLAMVEAYRPDLVILDVAMPGEDGFRLCERLRARPGLRALPVLFLTALHESAAFPRALAVNGDAFLSKPFDPAELRETVSRLIGTPGRPA